MDAILIFCRVDPPVHGIDAHRSTSWCRTALMALSSPEQARVLLKQLPLIYPQATDIFIMGDANDLKTAPSIKQFLDNGFKDPFEGQDDFITFHDFGKMQHGARIDYIFYRSKNYISKKTFVDDRTDNFYSDHYYLSTNFTLTQ